MQKQQSQKKSKFIIGNMIIAAIWMFLASFPTYLLFRPALYNMVFSPDVLFPIILYSFWIFILIIGFKNNDENTFSLGTSILYILNTVMSIIVSILLIVLIALIIGCLNYLP